MEPEYKIIAQKFSDIVYGPFNYQLGQVKNMTSLAWTSDPTAYVVSNSELLHKWDLDELSNARVFVMPGDDDEVEFRVSVAGCGCQKQKNLLILFFSCIPAAQILSYMAY
ncbi:MAG: hypothetical protein LBU70_09310 [Chitinispirillales bacterium]|nr:hypothetical protein [Chitinispirillales bacterium]